MPVSDMALATLRDIGRHMEFKMAATKPEVEIAFERKELAERCQRLSSLFRLHCVSKKTGHVRHVVITSPKQIVHLLFLAERDFIQLPTDCD